MKTTDLSDDEILELHAKIQELKRAEAYEKTYYKLKNFKPYEYQKQFYRASKQYKRRLLCAANRVGKSFCEAAEFAWHATGLYPDDYEGYRFIKSEMVDGAGNPNPHDLIMWAVGITGDSTRKVLQKELFGTESAKFGEGIGSGSIPRHCIDFDQIERDGNKILVAKVAHHDPNGDFDGWTTIEFRSTTAGEHVLMGSTVDYIWLDEEDPFRSTQIYAQCVTRTATTGGHVVATATPENGRTAFVDMFMRNVEGKLYFQNATWADCPHLTPEVQEELLASIPKWQREMRTKGIPLVGEGLVFDIEAGLESLMCEPIPIPDHWLCVCGVDIGFTHETAATWSAYDPNTDTIYVYDSYAVEGQTPAYHAPAIRSKGDWIPVVFPHDADNTERGSGQDVLSFYRAAGVNAMVDTFYNPLDLTNGKRNNNVMTGITDIKERMATGRLKIFNTPNNQNLLAELQNYQVKDGKIVKKNDDKVDSFRYSTMSVIYRGEAKGDAFNRGFHSDSSYGTNNYQDDYYVDDGQEYSSW